MSDERKCLRGSGQRNKASERTYSRCMIPIQFQLDVPHACFKYNRFHRSRGRERKRVGISTQGSLGQRVVDEDREEGRISQLCVGGFSQRQNCSRLLTFASIHYRPSRSSLKTVPTCSRHQVACRATCIDMRAIVQRVSSASVAGMSRYCCSE